jgi:aspartate/methionine/tyrosine aminotransferase
MDYSSLVDRISGESADVWAIHYEAQARRNRGEDILILSLGQESDQYTPSVIQQTAIDSIRNGRHHYAPVLGEDALRRAIAIRHQQYTGQTVTADNVAVFSGAQNALFATSLCLLEFGSEVIVPELYYATYPASVTIGGAQLVSLPTYPDNGFQMNLDTLEQAITNKTRAILLNSPNNPTGTIYSRDCLTSVVALCIKHDLWIISDEVYAEIAPGEFVSVSSLEGASDRTVTINSVSKSHRMTGWRCGWTVSPESLNRHFYNLNICMAYGLPPFIQDAAVTALEEDTETANDVRSRLSIRRALLENECTDLTGAKLYSGGGGMFAVLDIRPLQISSTEFAWNLLEKHKVSLLPCDGFGSSGRGLLRISLCEPDGIVVAGAQRICEFVRNEFF